MSGTTRSPSSTNMPPIDDDDIPVRRNAMDRDDDDVPAPSVTPAPMPRPVAPVMPSTPSPMSSPSSMSSPMGGGYTPRPPMSGSMGSGGSGDATNFYANIAANSEGKSEEHWVKAYWRPAMGWLYMLICFMDFVIFPALAMVLPAILKGFGVTIVYTAWQSLSLSNGGLIHVAFGAILGVAAWSRGKEKIEGKH